jgi:hypothetical protein
MHTPSRPRPLSCTSSSILQYPNDIMTPAHRAIQRLIYPMQRLKWLWAAQRPRLGVDNYTVRTV